MAQTPRKPNTGPARPDDGLLAAADLSGPFYGDQGEVDYRLEVSDYGTEKDITAP